MLKFVLAAFVAVVSLAACTPTTPPPFTPPCGQEGGCNGVENTHGTHRFHTPTPPTPFTPPCGQRSGCGGDQTK